MSEYGCAAIHSKRMSGLRRLLQSISRRYMVYLDIRGVINPNAVAGDIESHDVRYCVLYLDMRGVNNPYVAIHCWRTLVKTQNKRRGCFI